MSIFGKYSLGFLLLMVIAGCTAKMVVPPGSSISSRYAPQNEPERCGIMKYLNQGASSVIQARREDAYKQMWSLCNGSYKIVWEGPYQEGTAAGIIPVGGMLMAFSQPQQYWYIKFKCIQ